MLIVPEELQRNAANVHSMEDPANTGSKLLNYMCRRIGIGNFEKLDILDFGCGVRFSQAIINKNIPIGTYTGIEIVKKIVDFLRDNVNDPRMSYYLINDVNSFYNPDGNEASKDHIEPINGNIYNVICMFSVITHQNPTESQTTFSRLRNHIDPDGYLFFTAFVHDGSMDFTELNPNRPGQKCSYSRHYINKILENTGWSIQSIVGPNPEGLPMQTSIVCKPV